MGFEKVYVRPVDDVEFGFFEITKVLFDRENKQAIVHYDGFKDEAGSLEGKVRGSFSLIIPPGSSPTLAAQALTFVEQFVQANADIFNIADKG